MENVLVTNYFQKRTKLQIMLNVNYYIFHLLVFQLLYNNRQMSEMIHDLVKLLQHCVLIDIIL